MKTFFAIGAIFLLNVVVYENGYGQKTMSIHQVQNMEYESLKQNYSEQQWDSINQFIALKSVNIKTGQSCNLKKIVFGWHPYWNGTGYNEYDFSLLSDIAYFSYEVDPSTGSYSSIHAWKTTPVIDLAKAAGTRVSLSVTLFSGHHTLFENEVSCQTLIDSLINLVTFRGATGVNIDFEAVPSSQRDNLSRFIKNLGSQFHNKIPGSLVSIAIPSINKNQTFDVKSMVPFVDLFIIMGYDYYYGGSSNAGPVSPKNNGKQWPAYDVTRSVRYYLEAGVPNQKLCLGVPYYGYDWPTMDEKLNSPTEGKGNARLYKDAVSRAADYGRLWDRHASVPYFVYQTGEKWRQCWYDDATSLGYKYDLVNMYNIAGIGIWALGYDRSKTDLWNVLREKFSNCGNNECFGKFNDMGGPEGNYFSPDQYSFTIQRKDTGMLSLVFNDFDVAATDTICFYDGKDFTGKLLEKLTGTQTPGVISSKNGAISIRFVSAGTKTSKGWEAQWNCGESLVPESLNLSHKSLYENLPFGSFIGRLSINGNLFSTANTKQTFSNNDNSDNSNFTVSGDSLFSKVVFNFEKRKSYKITVQGIDYLNRNVANAFEISVIDKNDPPVFLKQIPNVSVKLGEPFQYTLPENLTYDEDGDRLSLGVKTISGSVVPAWLLFDSITNTFYGIPGGDQAETLKLLLEVSDSKGGISTTSFGIDIEKPVGYIDSLSSEIMVYPNPSRGTVYLVVSRELGQRLYLYVDVLDSKGKKTGQYPLLTNALHRRTLTLDLSFLPKGLYFLKIRAGDKIYAKKVIVFPLE